MSFLSTDFQFLPKKYNKNITRPHQNHPDKPPSKPTYNKNITVEKRNVCSKIPPKYLFLQFQCRPQNS